MKHAYLLYTGFGKTKMCLDKIMNAPRKPRTLLISTKNVVDSAWPAEIDKWYPGKISYVYITGDLTPEQRLAELDKPADILAMNTDMIEWYIDHTTRVKRKDYLKSGVVERHDESELIKRFDLFIIDEVSLFKNSQSHRFKLIKKWAHLITNVMILSATPTPKDIEDLWSTIYLIDGGQRLGTSITKFRESYSIPVPMPNGRNRYDYTQAAQDEILSLVKDIVTSIPEPKAPLFPEPILRKVLIKPDPATEEMLKRFKADFIVKLSNGADLLAFSKTQLINKINQMASGDVYNDNLTVHLNDLKLLILKMKLATIKTPVLILYTYKFDLDKLLLLPGARLLKHRKDFDDWNANKVPIGILSPFSSAHGLNLQDSDCVDIIWFSPIWDTEKWIQTNARVCRRGQRFQVTISVLLLKDSYDEYAFDLCLEKYRVQYNNLKKLQ